MNQFMKNITEIYAYREMIVNLVRRELQGRYKGSVLGFAWAFINPLLQLCVYTLVFSVIMKAGIEDYYLFLFVALIPWIFFATSVAAGSNCVRGYSDLVKKIYFPREVLPVAFVTSQFVTMLLSLIVVFAVLLLSGRGVSPEAVLYLPFVMLIEYALALALTMIASSTMIYLRDVEHMLNIIIMVWQFVTPVMYSMEQVPSRIKPLFLLNPMTPIIIAYRDILYYKRVPQVGTLLHAGVFSIVLLIAGWATFSILKRHFAEEL